MRILNPLTFDWPTPEDIVRSTGSRVTSKLIRKAEKALNISAPLAHPALITRWGDVLATEESEIALEFHDPDVSCRLPVGSDIRLIGGARKLLISLATVGSDIDLHIRRAGGAGDMLMAYLIDAAGVAILERIGRIVRKEADTEAKAHEWGIGPCISPGSTGGWPLEGQTALFELLSAHEIGVVLNPQGMLIPPKSVINVIAVGECFDSRSAASSCRYCAMRGTCHLRKIYQGNQETI